MRFPALPVLGLAAVGLCVAVAPVSAQEQEQGLQQRLLSPSENLEFQGWDSSFNAGAGTYEAGKARVKEYNFINKTRPKKFETEDFLGTKGAWEGDFVFDTEAADTEGRYIIPKEDEEYLSESVKTEAAFDANKEADSGDVRDGDREYLGREAEKMQQIIEPTVAGNIGWEGKLEVMSVDDVRDLLNKNE